MAKLQQYTGDENIKVLNRKVGGKDHYYSYAHEDLVSFLDGLKSVGDGKWDVGNMSQRGGGKLKGRYSAGHQDGKDVDIAIPLKGGKSSMKKFKIEIDRPTEHGPNSFVKVDVGGLDDALGSGVDTEKLLEFLKYANPKANFIALDKSILQAVIDNHKDDPEHKDFIKKWAPKGVAQEKGPAIQHEDKHEDHIHVRLRGGIGSKEFKEKPSEEERKKAADKERKKSKLQKRRKYIPPDVGYAGASVGIGGQDNINSLALAIKDDIDFRKTLNRVWFKPLAGEPIAVEVPNKALQRAKRAGRNISSPLSLDQNQRAKAFQKIRNYANSSMSKEDLGVERGTKGGLLRDSKGSFDILTYSLMSAIAKDWNKGTLKVEYAKNRKRKFQAGLPLQENKRNKMMKITKEKLAQIIKEEVEAYKASQLSESIDVETLKILQAAIKQAYQEMTTPTDVDQTYANTGEPVSKDPKVMHQKAVEFIMSEVTDAIEGEMKSEVEMDLDEDGHGDVPSAVRAMKTMAEDALEMLDALEQMDGSLPTWWTNKMAVSASMLNKMRDYLLVPSMEEEMDEQ